MNCLVIADAERPEDRITITREMAERSRALVLAAYDGAARLSRRNPLFVRASAAVELLDKAGFEWGAELVGDGRYWAVIWMGRFLAGLRKRYRKTRPRFVEVF